MPKEQRQTRRYSEAFKLSVIEQIEQGRYTAHQAGRLYGCSPSSIHYWKKRYGKAHLLNKKVRIETMDVPSVYDRSRSLCRKCPG